MLRERRREIQRGKEETRREVGRCEERASYANATITERQSRRKLTRGSSRLFPTVAERWRKLTENLQASVQSTVRKSSQALRKVRYRSKNFKETWVKLERLIVTLIGKSYKNFW